MKVDWAWDIADFVKAAIRQVITSITEAVVIVIIVIFLFLAHSRGDDPIVTIPLSLVGAGAVMLVLGFSLNLLTLLAMVLAIGLLWTTPSWS